MTVPEGPPCPFLTPPPPGAGTGVAPQQLRAAQLGKEAGFVAGPAAGAV